MKYGVHQTNDNTSTDYDGTGFISERSSSGSFIHQFNKTGTYYFSSGFIDKGGFLAMPGMVLVEPPLSNVVHVNVKVNGKKNGKKVRFMPAVIYLLLPLSIFCIFSQKQRNVQHVVICHSYFLEALFLFGKHYFNCF